MNQNSPKQLCNLLRFTMIYLSIVKAAAALPKKENSSLRIPAMGSGNLQFVDFQRG
jgi:hypothetical protein